jgi:hypothetical protein
MGRSLHEGGGGMISSKLGMVRGLEGEFSSLELGGEGISLLALGRAAALPCPIAGSATDL